MPILSMIYDTPLGRIMDGAAHPRGPFCLRDGGQHHLTAGPSVTSPTMYQADEPSWVRYPVSPYKLLKPLAPVSLTPCDREKEGLRTFKPEIRYRPLSGIQLISRLSLSVFARNAPPDSMPYKPTLQARDAGHGPEGAPALCPAAARDRI